MNPNGIKLTWLGHAAFRVETPGGKTVIIDPFITNNPKCPESEKKSWMCCSALTDTAIIWETPSI